MRGAAAAASSRWQPWLALAGFGFLLHFVWELLQAPFFAGMASGEHWNGIVVCTRASGGDVLIVWAAYGAAAAWVRDRWWLARPAPLPVAVYLAAGLLVTVALEWLNVYGLRRWAYAPSMPLVRGVGLTPLLQWIVVPPLTLWLARRHLGPGPRP